MKKVLAGLAVILLLSGCGNTVEIEGEAVKYEDLVTKVSEKQTELDTIEQDLETVKNELKENEEELELLNSMKAEQEQMQNDLSNSKEELEGLQSDIQTAEEELQSIQGQIVKSKDEPIRLGAGHYIVGKDLPAGRYEATPDGKGSNFSVHTDADRLHVNTILGSMVDSYIFEVSDGYLIQTAAPVKLTAVE